jgi:hypothetical protein
MTCPACGIGKMIFGGQAHGMTREVFPHYCENCNNYEIYYEKFPRIETVVVKTPMPRFDLTNVHFNPTDLEYESDR